MVTKKQYIEYLLHTPINYTGSNLANHLEQVSHDAVSDYLNREKATARQVWELAKEIIKDKRESYLIVDDSVQDKRYSRKIELVKNQYSGAEHGLVNGIGIVNLVHSDGTAFAPIDYCLYAPMQDGKTKNEHFRDMLIKAKTDKGIQANTVLFDSWYGSVENIKLIHRMGMQFITTLKENRRISLSKEGGYIHLEEIEWTEEQLAYGVKIRLQEVPFHVQLFKLVAPDGNIDWVITNCPERISADLVQKENKVRWNIETMHRELKQLTGIEKCQARKSRSQRNHISYCYQAWFALKRQAQIMKKTVYAVRNDLFAEYLKTMLTKPIIPAYHLAA
ncbi:MAG: IS701 family transposase [Nitrosotalea sp.]